MKHFFRGGRGLSKKWGHESFIYQSERKLNVFRLSAMSPLGFLCYGSRYKIGTQRNDEQEGIDEGSESLRTMVGLASPLLRPYTTDLPCFDHRFTTFASGILGQTVVKRWFTDGQTPKLVRSRCESDQEEGGLSSFIPTDYLPYNYDVSRRVQENRKTVTKTKIEKRIAENEGDADKIRKAPDLAATVYRLSSAQVLPWFCFCSTALWNCN